MKLMAEAVSVMRGDRMVVTHLSFGVEAGEALVLVGPNGAGKTTLIRCIAGLLKPSAGQIRLEGGSLSARWASNAIMLGTSTA